MLFNLDLPYEKRLSSEGLPMFFRKSTANIRLFIKKAKYLNYQANKLIII
ncbi:hypothetical protein SAMN05421856_104249 [Chryseobacterium taichungense]|uniref:Uncharacterized protein n=1 Tax=Chryseobacterium taichungense TaxID=295069 RepID=A0A1H7ZEZ1_9FLAO|nr:hypothetical protein SAMN05421856_104249 [Chryseobacterium taichungense]